MLENLSINMTKTRIENPKLALKADSVPSPLEPDVPRSIVHEAHMDNWGIRGGIPAPEVDLGIKIGV